MKKSWPLYRLKYLCIISLLIVCTLFTACSAPIASSSASVAANQVFQLKLAHHLPPTAPGARVLDAWTKKIEADTGGRVKFAIYPSESLAKGTEALDSTVAGICDVAYINLVYEPSKLSLNSIVNLAALAVPTDDRGTEIWNKLLEKYPQMLKEFTGVKILSDVISMTISLHTKVAARVPDDIKGMKIAGMGDSLKILEAAGASPISLSAGDWYSSIQKGIIEGVLAPIGTLTDRGVQEQLKYHLDLGIGQSGNIVIINLERWNSFPDDIKAVFEGLNLWLNDAMTKANQQVEIEGWQKCANSSITKPSVDEFKLWLADTQPSVEDWIEANASKAPSREMFEYAQKLIAEIK